MLEEGEFEVGDCGWCLVWLDHCCLRGVLCLGSGIGKDEGSMLKETRRDASFSRHVISRGPLSYLTITH